MEHKKIKNTLIRIGLLLVGAILTFLVVANYQKSNNMIEIVGLPEKNELSSDVGVRIVEITVDGKKVDFSKLQLEDGWSITEDGMLAFYNKEKAIAQLIPCEGKEIAISFLQQNCLGKMEVIMANYTIKIDTYGDTEWKIKEVKFQMETDVFINYTVILLVLIIISILWAFYTNKLLNKKVLFNSTVFVICSICLYFNFTTFTTDYGDTNFDLWSENIMVADLNYHDNYSNKKVFLNVITPGSKVLNESHIIENPEEITMKYISGSKFNEEDYKEYTSNICGHRYIYYLIDSILTSKENTLVIMHAFNCIMLALVCVVIMEWISYYFDKVTAVTTIFVIVFFGPNFVMFGRNLYWSAWSLFLPLVGSILITMQATKKDRICISKAVIVVFLTCLVKQIFYFEFLSTVMISAIIPFVLFFIMDEKETSKKKVSMLFFVSLSAILSFLFTSGIKIIMLYFQCGNTKQAITAYFYPIIYRLIGDVKSNQMEYAESALVPFSDVLEIMMNKPALSINNILFISQGMTIIIYFILLIISIRRNGKKMNVRYAWTIVTGIGLIAPLSWFILAKPHTYWHNSHCSITWYIPYSFMFLAIITHNLYEAILKSINYK